MHRSDNWASPDCTCRRAAGIDPVAGIPCRSDACTGLMVTLPPTAAGIVSSDPTLLTPPATEHSPLTRLG